MRLRRLVYSALMACAVGVQAQVQMFPLGDLAGGDSYSRPTALSGNGQVAVGYGMPDSPVAGYEAFRWTNDSGMTGLGIPRRGESLALGVSPNGLYVVGYSTSRTNETIGMVWRSDGGSIELPNVVLSDASNNGVAVGSTPGQAIRWTESGGVQPLGFLNDTDTDSWAYSVSVDGSVIAGSGTSGYWLWTESQGMQAVGWDGFNSYNMTNDGGFLVGTSYESVNGRLARVPVALSLESGRINLDITDLPQTGFGMIAHFASLAADIILGTRNEHGKTTPYIWLDRGKVGMIFEDYLLANGFDITQTGYELVDVAGVSDDGTRFLLNTYNPEREYEAVLFVIPAPASTIPLLGAMLSFQRRRAV